jgi:hypothetical protein
MASKYRNVRTAGGGITFASKAEAKRYGELKLLERAKQISDLELQPWFQLMVADVVVSNYVGDFKYFERGRGVVEDVKGVQTDAFKIKWALAKALLPHIDWRIIPA